MPLRASLLILAILSTASGCTVQYWKAAMNDRLTPYSVEGLLVDRTVTPPTPKAIVVAYQVEELPEGIRYHLAIPVAPDLTPQFPYTATEVDKQSCPILAGQKEAIQATPFSAESSHAVSVQMKSADFIPRGRKGGIDFDGGWSSGNEGDYLQSPHWCRFWRESDSPGRTTDNWVDYGTLLLLPGSLPRPHGEQLVTLTATAAITPVTLVTDAVGTAVFLPWFIVGWSWGNPDVYDAMVKFTEWVHRDYAKYHPY